MSEHIPTEIRLRSRERLLVLSFDDGSSFELACELLRAFSPSAEVSGHGPEQRKTPTGIEHVNIDAVEPVGNYAVRLRFDDGHDSGLYTWDHLHKLGKESDAHWQQYLDELKELGYERDAGDKGNG